MRELLLITIPGPDKQLVIRNHLLPGDSSTANYRRLSAL